MLGQITCPAAQISACRTEMTAMAAKWRAVARASEATAREAAEAQVFNQMVVALERRFAQTLRGVEGKDCKLVNEVRLLSQGVSGNGGYFPSDDVVRWRPEASITGYRAGDRIRLGEAVFSRLAKSYLDAIADRFAYV
ncbi:MAG: hypothetical protein ACOH2H_17050 [Cypionkella sp.]